MNIAPSSLRIGLLTNRALELSVHLREKVNSFIIYVIGEILTLNKDFKILLIQNIFFHL